MAFNFANSLSSILGSTPKKPVSPTAIPSRPTSPLLSPNPTVPNLISSLAPKPAPSVPSFATPAPSTGATQGPVFSGPQPVPQVQAHPTLPPAPTGSMSSSGAGPLTPSGLTLEQAMAIQNANQNQGGSSQDAPGPQNHPIVPNAPPETQKAVDSAVSAYEESLKISPDELATQEDLDKLQESTKKAYLDTNNQPIPLEFITGQLKSIEQRALGLAEPLEKKLARLQAQRTSSLEASKFALDRADKNMAAERDKNKPIAGTSFYDPVTGTFKQAPSTTKDAGFTLSPGEKRYDANGKLIASGGPKPQTQAQETAAIAKTEKETQAQQQSTQSIGIINNLLSGDKYKNITGIGQNPLNFVGLGNAAEINQYNQLQGLLKLGVRSLIKGQGTVSDYEGKILGDASSALGRNLSNGDFKQALLNLRGVMNTNSGGETPVIVKDKNGKVLGQGSLNGQEIYEAVKDGNTIQYL